MNGKDVKVKPVDTGVILLLCKNSRILELATTQMLTVSKW